MIQLLIFRVWVMPPAAIAIANAIVFALLVFIAVGLASAIFRNR